MTAVHGFPRPGSCHQVRLLPEQLGPEYRCAETGSSTGAMRTPGYSAKNPNGRVPMPAPDAGAHARIDASG